jgi:hypothetical protein
MLSDAVFLKYRVVLQTKISNERGPEPEAAPLKKRPLLERCGGDTCTRSWSEHVQLRSGFLAEQALCSLLVARLARVSAYREPAGLAGSGGFPGFVRALRRGKPAAAERTSDASFAHAARVVRY